MAGEGSEVDRVRQVWRISKELRGSESILIATAMSRVHDIVCDLLLEVELCSLAEVLE